ncbi:hypothetical protein PAPHI01_2251 [Pancytospora philotis]|nr:hypothetical protein PAPHI01_2251 [Pancytospora philotis]
MRYTVTFTCIAQCFAAYMWRRAGLLTKDDCALLVSVGILPANDSGKSYEPHDFERFTQKITCLAKPIRGDNPLQVDGYNTTAVGNYREWKEQLLEKMLRIYVEHAYEEDSFEKREGAVDLVALINERTEEFERLFSPSEQLRMSRDYILSLMRLYDSMCYDFGEIIAAIDRLWRQFPEFGKDFEDKSLDSLEDAAIAKLNTLREELDNRSKFAVGRRFKHSISNVILGTVTNPKAISDDIVKSYRDFCEKGLAHAHKIPEEISRKITLSCIKHTYVEDIYKHVHYVYPELDYEGWGSSWRAVQNQVTGELEALRKHVDDVQRCRSRHRLESYVKYLVENADYTFKTLGTLFRDRAASRELIDGAIIAVAKNISALGFDGIDKLTANKTESNDGDMVGSDNAINPDFKLMSADDTVTSNDNAPGPSRKRTYSAVTAEGTPTSVGGVPQHSRTNAAPQSKKPYSNTEPIERMRGMLEVILAVEFDKSQSDSELLERMCNVLVQLKTEVHPSNPQSQPETEE